MPPEPTTTTETPAASDPPATAPASGGQPGQTGVPSALPSSRELRQAGENTDLVDWRARYDGLVGSSRELLRRKDSEADGLHLEITNLRDQLAAAQSRIADLTAQAGTLAQMQTDLEAARTRVAELERTQSRQRVLMKFPSLLAVKPAEGEAENPMVKMVMGSTLEGEELERTAQQLAATLPAPDPNLMQAAVPAARPGSSEPMTPEQYRKLALEAHQRFLDSGRADAAAAAEESKYWELSRQAAAAS